eukprot:TRINITY_DN20504_c0_g1_i2.p1 TRINITY_DN20504_c0_g1~~TRINITY_DN20504_c0_g1_i2.p1  ORF type:complete len:205 (+),score=30.19 TRINITY_DN20504_c0_g1_i2:367-981(+)
MLGSPAIGIHGAQAAELHAMADVDGNGIVDFNEFVAIMFNPDLLTQEQLEEHFKTIFDSIASRQNSDGRLDSKDGAGGGGKCPKGHLFGMVRTSIVMVGPPAGPGAAYPGGLKAQRPCASCSGALSTSGDGSYWTCLTCRYDVCKRCSTSQRTPSKARITRAELEAMFPEGMSRTLISQLFREMDRDNDGAIDYDEFRDFLAAM